VARRQQRVANARKGLFHKTSTTIAKSHGTVAPEALPVRSMSASTKGTAEAAGRNVRAKAGLNRAILDQGWRSFRIMLGYKPAERGGRLIEAPAADTSQTGAACGVIAAGSRRDQPHFVCVACGHAAHADTDAAINILRRADCTLRPVEGYRTKRPGEAGTPGVRLHAEHRNSRHSRRGGCQRLQ
jgi:putative transposase